MFIFRHSDLITSNCEFITFLWKKKSDLWDKMSQLPFLFIFFLLFTLERTVKEATGNNGRGSKKTVAAQKDMALYFLQWMREGNMLWKSHKKNYTSTKKSFFLQCMIQFLWLNAWNYFSRQKLGLDMDLFTVYLHPFCLINIPGCTS